MYQDFLNRKIIFSSGVLSGIVIFLRRGEKTFIQLKKKCNFIPLTGKNVTHLKTFKIVSECGLMVTFKYFNFCLS